MASSSSSPSSSPPGLEDWSWMSFLAAARIWMGSIVLAGLYMDSELKGVFHVRIGWMVSCYLALRRAPSEVEWSGGEMTYGSRPLDFTCTFKIGSVILYVIDGTTEVET